MAKIKPKNKTILIKELVKKTMASRKKKPVVKEKVETEQLVGIPGLVQPTEHDLQDELVRMDSFAYRNYNE
jgi:hypothetical protein